MRAYMHTYINACIHTYIHACIHTCTHACIHTHIHTYKYIDKHKTHAYKHTRVYVYTHIFTHIVTISKTLRVKGEVRSPLNYCVTTNSMLNSFVTTQITLQWWLKFISRSSGSIATDPHLSKNNSVWNERVSGDQNSADATNCFDCDVSRSINLTFQEMTFKDLTFKDLTFKDLTLKDGLRKSPPSWSSKQIAPCRFHSPPRFPPCQIHPPPRFTSSPDSSPAQKIPPENSHKFFCANLQSVAECCSVLQCTAVCCSVLQCVAMCCSVLQCVARACFLQEGEIWARGPGGTLNLHWRSIWKDLQSGRVRNLHAHGNWRGVKSAAG